MNADTRQLLARLTQTAEDLSHTEGMLRRQRIILREQATALRLGEAPAVVVSRLKAAKAWAAGDLSVDLHR